jgi:hypothetical protein
VDPLTRDYPSWTPYAFAMNRVIDGVDLDGAEYVDAKKSFFNISGGTTWLKPAVVKFLYPSLYFNPNFSGGTDPFGNRYIGKTVPSSSFTPSRPSTNILSELNFDPSIRDQDPSSDPIRDNARDSKNGSGGQVGKSIWG